MLTRADQLPDDAVWDAHQKAKRELIALVEAKTGVKLSADIPIIKPSSLVWLTQGSKAANA